MQKNLEATYTEAFGLYKARDFDKAILLYRELVEVHPDSIWAGFAQTQIKNIESDPSYTPAPALVKAMKEKEEARAQKSAELQTLRSSHALTLRDYLKEYIGESIGINAIDPSKTVAAKLVDVQQEFFTVQLNGLLHSIPYGQIVKLIRAPQGNVTLGVFKGEFSLVVRVFDFVVYKGGISFGMAIPI